MTQKLFVTTPIYYVNGRPHLGHAYTSVAADVISRFYRMEGGEVLFLTGTDEHGQKVEKAAQQAGISPQAYADQVSLDFQQLKDLLNLSYDQFIRTTEPRHKKAAQHLWSLLVQKDLIYRATYAGWYALRDEAYYQESELVDGKAPTGADVEWVEEDSYFFRLSAFQEPLLAFYRAHPEAIAPKSRYNEVVRFIEGGLRDLSISRCSFSWGIPVPENPEHVIYVWLDALTNYITALGYPDQPLDAYWDNVLHLVGKDILRFHAVYWPAFLMGADLPPPQRIFAHGWWVSEGQKMSKSLGNVVDPFEIVSQYGADAMRYFLMREVAFGQDGDFSLSAFTHRVNADLANDYGNLCQRVLAFVQKHSQGVVPTPGELQEADHALLGLADGALPPARAFMAEQALHKYCETFIQIIVHANRYIDAQQPWSLRQSDPARMATVLYVLMEIIRKVSLLALPVVPRAADRALDYVGVASEGRSFATYHQALDPGVSLPAPAALFPRCETPVS